MLCTVIQGSCTNEKRTIVHLIDLYFKYTQTHVQYMYISAVCSACKPTDTYCTYYGQIHCKCMQVSPPAIYLVNSIDVAIYGYMYMYLYIHMQSCVYRELTCHHSGSSWLLISRMSPLSNLRPSGWHGISSSALGE